MTDMTPSLTTELAARTQGNARAVKTQPGRVGLYDPRNEHDACGVGFIAQMKNVKSHQIVKDGLFMLENLTHRGAVGADPLMGDGAGVLVQIPDKFFRREMAAQGVELAAGRPVCRRPLVHAAGRAKRLLHVEELIRESCSLRRVSRCSASATCRSTTRPCRRRPTSQRPNRCTGRSSSAAGRGLVRGGVRAAALYSAQGDLREHLRRARQQGCRLLRRVAVGAHHRLQGHVPRLPGRRLLQGPLRSALRVRAGPRPPALLDQHLPVVEARPSVPHGRAQRRDQHAARQRQLDGGAAGVGRFRAVRQRHLQAVADLLRGAVGHGLLRQRARVPGPGRLLAGPCR
jgi:hypothetical protein